MADSFGKDMGKRLEIVESMKDDAEAARHRLLNPLLMPPKPGGSWKVLVYMAAYGALRPFAERDLWELCKVEDSPQVKIAVQVHWEEGKEPHLPDVKHGNGNNLRFAPDQKKSDKRMKEHFEAFLKKARGHEQRCLVVLWGHAIDGQFGGFDGNGMELDEIAEALSNAKTAGISVDILGFDACDMSRVEMLEKLSGHAKVLIGSQIGVPFSGWPYHTILEQLKDSPGWDEHDLGRIILNEYYDSYRPPRVTLTMLDGGLQRQYEQLRGSVGSVTAALDSLLAPSPEILDVLRDTFEVARRDLADPLLDLRDFCDALVRNLNASQSIPQNAKAAVVTAVQLLIEMHDQVVTHHERRGPLVTGLNGIGISAYTITERWNKKQLETFYDRVGMRPPPEKGRGA